MRLTAAIDRYISHRQAMGESATSTGRRLRHFARRIGRMRALDSISLSEVRTYLDGVRPWTRYWHNKHSALRGFFRFCVAREWLAAAPLPVLTPRIAQRFRPYIYREEEIKRLITLAAEMHTPWTRFEPPTFRLFLLLLYGCGLRVSEALRLCLNDVRLDERLLVIRETKFGKTRLVPVGRQIGESLRHYLDTYRRRASLEPETPLLIFNDGHSVRASCARRAFERLRARAGIVRRDASPYQPRLHDMRHSFTVKTLTAWYRSGADVQALLPALSTYLGHTSIAATQVYLTMTPELLALASMRFARYAESEKPHE